MDEVSDSLAAAWKQAMKGVKSGYKMTKTALKNIPTDKLKVGNASGMTGGDMRRMFQAKYGVEVRNEEGDKFAVGEGSDIESSDEEALTDEQIHEKVDKKYFDKQYNAVHYELTHMEATYTDDEEELKKERAAAEVRILELRQKCDIVSTTLKKRVLANHNSFVSGVEKIKEVNDSLYQTSNDCKKARKAVRKTTANVSSQIALIAQSRTRTNINETLSLIEAMNHMMWKRNQLHALIHSGKLIEAASLLKTDGPIALEEKLNRVYCMKSVIAEWKRYRDDPREISNRASDVLTECLTVKFIESTYRNAVESAQQLGNSASLGSFIAQQLWQSAVQILVKSLAEMSFVKSEGASIADIAEGIHPDHIMLCLCQTAAKLMDFLFLYSTVLRIHQEEMNANSELSSLHKSVYENVSVVGHKIGRDLVEKVVLALSNARIIGIDVDRVLHIFVIISMLVEAMSSLGLDKQEMASARTQVKSVLLQYMQIAFQTPKAKDILHFMGEENWRVSDVSALSLNVVKPLSPEFYKRSIKIVKNYLSGAISDSFVENPFYAPNMLEPQDTSSLMKTELFSAYWASVKESNPTEGAVEGNLLPGAPGGRRTSIEAGETLAWKAPLPPTTITSSALSVTNAFLEYEARIAVRFPPLAADILEWCDELVSLYIFIVADNFVSVSKSVPIENQGDFSQSTQLSLRNMRNASCKVLNVSNGYYIPSKKLDLLNSSNNASVKFPPRVWNTIKDDFASEAKQYALGNRVVACDACVTLVYYYEALVHSIAPLLPTSLSVQFNNRCKELYHTAVEMMNVGIHRLCLALFPMKTIIHDIGKMKWKKDEVTVSGYVPQIVVGMKALNAKRQPMPTPALEALFLQRFIFSVQFVLVQEYAKLAKKKLTDVAVMQLQVDAQTFQQQAAAEFGRENIVRQDHVLGLIKTGFYMDDKQQIVSWLRTNHKYYNAVDLLNWFAGSDKVFKLQLEDISNERIKT